MRGAGRRAGAAVHDDAQDRADEEDRCAGDPLGPARARAQLDVLAGEQIDLGPLLGFLLGELLVAAAEIHDLRRELLEARAQLHRLGLVPLEKDARRGLGLQVALRDPAVHPAGGPHLCPALGAREDLHRVAGPEHAEDPVLHPRAGADVEPQLVLDPGAFGVAGAGQHHQRCRRDEQERETSDHARIPLSRAGRPGPDCIADPGICRGCCSDFSPLGEARICTPCATRRGETCGLDSAA